MPVASIGVPEITVSHRTLAIPDARRRRLLFGLPGGFILASPLALVACGSDGLQGVDGAATGGDDPDAAAVAAVVAKLPAVKRTTQAVTVALPSGSGVATTGTTVVCANSIAAVASDATSSIVQIEGAPQMGYVVDATGRVLLMGVVETGKRTTLDSRSTAEALLLIASEAALQGDAMELAVRRVLAQSSADAVVEPVRLAVEAAAARNGIDADDQPLMAALAASVTTMRASASAAAAKSVRSARPLGVSPRPVEPQSGVSVEDGGDFNTAQLQNAFRRRTHVWLTRVAYIDDDGNRVDLPAPVPVPAPKDSDFDLDATVALSFDSFVTAVGDFLAELGESIGFLGEYEAGSAFFSPVRSDPFPLPVVAGDGTVSAKVAIYRTRVVGVGNHVGLARTAEESEVLERLWGDTFRLDIALPFLKTFILPLLSEAAGAAAGPGGLKATEEVLLNAILDIASVNEAGTFFPNTIAALKAGDAGALLTSFWTEFSTSNTWLKVLEIGMRATVSAAAGDSAAVAASEVKGMVAAFTKLARIVAVLRAAATLGDYGALLKDWAAASQLSSAEVFVSKAKVTLSPSPLHAIAFAGADGKATVTADIGDLDGTFAPENVFLTWSCTGRYGHLYKLGFDDVDTFESTLASPSHAYIPGGVEPDPANPDTITVTAVYRNPTTAVRSALGTATTTVVFDERPTYSVLTIYSLGDGTLTVTKNDEQVGTTVNGYIGPFSARLGDVFTVVLSGSTTRFAGIGSVFYERPDGTRVQVYTGATQGSPYPDPQVNLSFRIGL